MSNHPSPIPQSGNLFNNLEGSAVKEECFEALLTIPGIRLERIVSYGHATPEGQWYDQETSEWVVLLKGHAHLQFEDEPTPRVLQPGDYIYIPPHKRHRVQWTDPDTPVVWLAFHFDL